MLKKIIFLFLLPFTIELHAMDSTIEQIEPSIDEKTTQQAIRSLALRENISDTQAIGRIQSKDPIWATILKNIHRLFFIASHDTETFSTEDLADKWYVNSTMGFHCITLLFSAFQKEDHKKIQALYKAGFNHPDVQYEKSLIENALEVQYNGWYMIRPLGQKPTCYNLECIRALLEHSSETLIEKFFYPPRINVLINEVKRYKDLKESDKVMELVEEDHDILFLFIEYICQAHKWEIGPIKRDLQALSCTNKNWNLYLSCEKTRKKIIRTIALKTQWNDACTANALKYKTIHEKILRFFEIADSQEEPFSENALSDTWYLSTTKTYVRHSNNGGLSISHMPYGEPGSNQTLLLSSIAHHNIKKMIILLDAKIDPNCARASVHPLEDIIKNYENPDKSSKGSSYKMVQLLLKRGVNPDYRECAHEATPLACAVVSNHKGLARLLLRFGANPHALIHFGDNCDTYPVNHTIQKYNPKEPHLKNVFCLEKESKGWLTKMVHEVKKNPNAKPIKKPSAKNNKDLACIKK